MGTGSKTRSAVKTILLFCNRAMVSVNYTLHWLQGVNKQRCSCPNGILRHPKGSKFHKDHERAKVEKERTCQSCFQSSQRSMLERLLGKLYKFDRVGLQVPSEVSMAHPAALYNVRRRPSADRRSACYQTLGGLYSRGRVSGWQTIMCGCLSEWYVGACTIHQGRFSESSGMNLSLLHR